MGIFDEFEDPLSEVGEALEDLGVPGASDTVEDATRAIQAAIDANGGVPDPTLRFLFGDPAPGTVPTADVDARDIVTQAGQIIDNFGGAGFGGMGAALANQQLTQDQYDLPTWWVFELDAEEEVSRPWRCELLLAQPTLSSLNNPAALQTLWDALTSDWIFDDANKAITGAPGKAIGGDPGGAMEDIGKGLLQDARDWWNAKTADPYGDTARFSDATDPDGLDRQKLWPAPPHIAPIAAGSFLGQLCRVCIARRFPRNKYTLTERWFTGIATEMEDLGAVGPLRMIRLVLEPRLSLLSLRKRYRIFRDLNAVQIVRKILDEHALYPADPGDTDQHAWRAEPGGADLFGPIGVPDAATAAIDKIAGAIPGAGGVGDAINSVLEKSIESWTDKREVCVQYGETDLELVERLLAEEGIVYFFEHIERRETLVLADDPRLAGEKTLTAARVPLPGFMGYPDITIRMYEFAWNVSVARALAPSGVTLRDRHYTRPYDETDLKAGESVSMMTPGGLSSIGTLGGLEQMANQALALGAELGGAKGTEDYAGPEAQFFEYPAFLPFQPHEDESGLYDAYGGPPLAEHRLEGFRARGASVRGKSNCTMLTPANNIRIGGLAFDVLHPPTGTAQRFMVTKVRHKARRDAGQAVTYENEFDGVNVNLRFRPALRARPRIYGVQTAIVIDVDTSASDDPALDVRKKDDMWRVRLRFAWDRGEADAPPGSGWVRFGGAFSGAGFGVVFTPRVGMEVVVGFEEGDPDRPVILGALYNGPALRDDHTYHPLHAKMQPDKERIHAPARMLESVVRTRTFGESIGPEQRGNRLRFDDHAGQEAIELFAQHDLKEEIGDDRVTSVVKDSLNAVEHDQSELVKGDQRLHVRHASSGETDYGRLKEVQTGEEKVEIGGGESKASSAIGGHDVLEILPEGKRTLYAEKGEELTVHGAGCKSGERPARKLRVGQNEKVEIDCNDVIEVFGDRRITAAGALEMNAKIVDMKTPSEETAAEGEAGGGLSFEDGNAKLASSGRIDVSGESITIESQGDRVFVRGEKKVWLHGHESSILLDGEERMVHIDGEKKVKLVTDHTCLELTDTKIQWFIEGELHWQIDVEGPATSTIKKTDALNLEGDEEILVNAAQVHINE